MLSRRPILALVLLLGFGFGLVACGGDDPAAPAPAAELSPDPATVMLGALAGRIGDGTGISDASWTRDVQEVGMVIWPDDAAPADLRARRDHTNLTHIAGDMASKLAGDEAARADWTAHDPLSVRVHDGFVEAAGAGVEAYRAWIEDGGRALLRERIEALQERPPR